MIFYVIDTQVRNYFYFFLALLCVSVTPLINGLLNIGGVQYFAPSAFMLYVFSIQMIDVLYPRFRFIENITGIPSLNGKWEGTIKRIKEGRIETRNITIDINQRWRHIALTFHGQNSKSEAKLVKLSFDNKNNITLKWVYDSRPSIGTSEQYNQLYGEGVTELALKYDQEQKKLEGHYYNSKLTRGSVLIRKMT